MASSLEVCFDSMEIIGKWRCIRTVVVKVVYRSVVVIQFEGFHGMDLCVPSNKGPYV